ncbi:MAG: hypothetical protein DRQ43_11470 [Gammaproteobacteria bacterium]|nr:MAG: hypothetical protein DRQ43_11470 [Gammaproteobacteria bacterium]
MNKKKIMIYAIAVLAAIIILKIIVAISWKLILLSLIILAAWFTIDKIIKPKIKHKLLINLKQ